MMTRDMIVSVVALSLAAAGCGKAPTRPPPPTPPPTVNPLVKTGQTVPLPTPCAATVPQPSGTPYVITLGPSFDLRHPAVSKSGHMQGSNPTPHKHNTSLDIVTQVSGPSSATVRIELTDPTLHFMDKALALLGSTSNAGDVFCGVAFDTTDPNDPRWLSFTVYPKGTDTYASYNLGLLVDSHGPPPPLPQLPVFIDPWVDNNGFVPPLDK
jgi:hypothetical protein